jgi:putative thioredoxin
MGGMNTPFSRPGAIDLSALKQSAPASGQAGRSGSATGRPGGAAPGGGYVVDVTEENFQSLLEGSMAAPVVLVVYSASRMPASLQLADDLATVVDELDGRLALGRVDADAQPGIAQAMQVQTIPFAAMVLQGRLAPLLQDAPPLQELRAMMGQLVQQLEQQGMTGRHQPFGSEGDEAATEQEEPGSDPRYAPAEDALVAGDLDRAVAEYDKLLAADPGDTEASVGKARAQLMQRTRGVDLSTARSAAADAPDDVEAQVLVADLDLLGGHVDDAFQRLVDLVRRTAGEERDRVRLHLIELFAVVGNDDARVLKARQGLASALF